MRDKYVTNLQAQVSAVLKQLKDLEQKKQYRSDREATQQSAAKRIVFVAEWHQFRQVHKFALWRNTRQPLPWKEVCPCSESVVDLQLSGMFGRGGSAPKSSQAPNEAPEFGTALQAFQ